MTGVFNEQNGHSLTISRLGRWDKDALATHKEGDVILSGSTSVGFTGFENHGGVATIAFGFPYREAPRTYIRKLTLAPEIRAFQLLKQGESISLFWEVKEDKAADFSDFVRKTWQYSYDTYHPEPVDTFYSVKQIKDVLSNYFTNSLVDKYPLIFNSGVHLRVDDCMTRSIAEVGFIGRTLLNAFNAWEYGWETGRDDLKENSRRIFDSYLSHGFTRSGFSVNILTMIGWKKMGNSVFVVNPRDFMPCSISWDMNAGKDVVIWNGISVCEICSTFSCNCRRKTGVSLESFVMTYLLLTKQAEVRHLLLYL